MSGTGRCLRLKRGCMDDTEYQLRQLINTLQERVKYLEERLEELRDWVHGDEE